MSHPAVETEQRVKKFKQAKPAENGDGYGPPRRRGTLGQH
jgi:hypothetical protein